MGLPEPDIEQRIRSVLQLGAPDLSQQCGQVVELQQQGRIDEALDLAKAVCANAQRDLSEDNPLRAFCLNNLAAVYKSMRNYEAAEPLYRQAIEMWSRLLDKNDPQYASLLHNLAGLYSDMENYEAAEPLYRQALEICRLTVGEDHPDYITTLKRLVLMLQEANRLAEAEPLMRRHLEFFRDHSIRGSEGHTHPELQDWTVNYAALLEQMGLSREEVKRHVMSILTAGE